MQICQLCSPTMCAVLQDILTETLDSTIEFCKSIEETQELKGTTTSPMEKHIPRKKRKKEDEDNGNKKFKSSIPRRIHGKAHDDRNCRAQQELIADAAAKHRASKKVRYDRDEGSDRSKKIGFKSRDEMKSFLISTVHKYLKKNKPNGLKRGRDECLHIDSNDEKLEKSEGEDEEINDDFAELHIDSDEDSE